MANKLDPQSLLNFVNCLAYVYHPDSKEIIADSDNDSKYIKKTILANDSQQVKNIFPVICSEFNVSPTALNRSWNGDKAPVKELLDSAKLIIPTSEYKSLVSKFMPKTSKHKKAVNKYRVNLINYLHSLSYLQNLSMTYAAKEMGTTQPQLKQTILYQAKDDDVLNALRQLPFILDTSSKAIEAILKGSEQPQKDMLVKYNQRIANQHDLRRYVNAITYLHGTNIKKLSKALGHSENYIGITIKAGTGNIIAKLFDEIAETLKMPNVLLMSALARANAKIAGHAYLTHMYFVVRYRHSPIQYKERHNKHLMDHKRISRGFTQLRKYLKRSANQKHLRKTLRQIFMGWSHVYGFNAKDFIDDNFNNFYKFNQKVVIKQGTQRYAVKNDDDWLVILKKIHHQLKTVKHSFNLSKVQSGPYSKYVYIGSIGRLDNPRAKYARRGLAKLNELGHDRYTFEGSFENTGVKTVRHGKHPWQEYYRPMIEFKNVKYNGKVIADHVWFNYTKSFIKLNQLEPGDFVTFSARVHKYYVGHITKRSVKIANYDLHYPTQVRLVRRIHARISQPVPTELHALIGYCIFHNHTTGYDFSYRNYQYIRECITAYKKWSKHVD